MYCFYIIDSIIWYKGVLRESMVNYIVIYRLQYFTVWKVMILEVLLGVTWYAMLQCYTFLPDGRKCYNMKCYVTELYSVVLYIIIYYVYQS